MASVNKVIIVGNLGRDPETRYSPDGAAITNAAIATSYQWKDKATGDKKEETEWHRVAFFGRLAEIAGEYLKKGSSVYIEGRLRTRKWQDKDGQDRYSTEVVAESMQMLGKREGMGGSSGSGDYEGGGSSSGGGRSNSGSGGGSSAGSSGGRPAPKKPAAFNDMDDDIPF